MANEQNEQPVDGDTTQQTDTGLLKQKPFQRTARIDEVPELTESSEWGNAFLGKRAQLTFKVDGHSDTSLQVTIKDQIVVGRASSSADEKPDLDLTPYDAAQLGVSRRHVLITKEGSMLKVVDLGSLNGTYLNGMQLRPNQPRVLRTGDRLNLGQLVLVVVGMS